MVLTGILVRFIRGVAYAGWGPVRPYVTTGDRCSSRASAAMGRRWTSRAGQSHVASHRWGPVHGNPISEPGAGFICA